MLEIKTEARDRYLYDVFADADRDDSWPTFANDTSCGLVSRYVTLAVAADLLANLSKRFDRRSV